jgi:hypothetical protein
VRDTETLGFPSDSRFIARVPPDVAPNCARAASRCCATLRVPPAMPYEHTGAASDALRADECRQSTMRQTARVPPEVDALRAL